MATYWSEYRGINPQRRYHADTSLSLALACLLAYEKKLGEIRAIAGGWGFPASRVLLLKKKLGGSIDTSCVVLGDDTDIIVAFTGSESADDWLANFQATFEPGPMRDCRAHRGFQDALYPIVISLTDTIQALRDKKQRVWLTGHSLGGALCLLYAGMRLENRLQFHGIYTFGSPRPADASFAERISEVVTGPLHRVVNVGDIVPHVPPEPFFSHPGQRRILGKQRASSAKRSWWRERVSALQYFVQQTGLGVRIADCHRLGASDKSYVPRLLAMVKKQEG